MSRILVTGASTGLGLAAARALVDDGHEVLLHARRVDRVEDAALLDRVYAVVAGDLADLEATRAVADQVNDLGPLDAVIHNAGVMHGPDVRAVNVVAPYVLTASLLPHHRDVYLSSSMHLSGSPDPTSASASYSTSKLLLTALALAVADLRPDGLSHAVDPGWVPTRMGGRGAPDDLEQGHETQVWLATAPATEIRPRSGAYWYHRAARDPHPATRDPDVRARLLEQLRTETGLDL